LIILRIAERYEEDLEAIFFVKLLYVTDLFGLADNVRRYVLLPPDRGGMCFCWLSRSSQSFSLLLSIVTGKNHDTTLGVHRPSGGSLAS
jgi:hypothetical protein